MITAVEKRMAVFAVLLQILFLSGCATAPPETKQDASSPYTVRFPGAEPVELEATTAPPVRQPELPPNDADEKKGRWLRVIEVERNSRPAAPATGEESAAPAAAPGN
ncbi:MAG: hypothetical protein C4529_04555 [Deltaproteobacteria bacterium]|nr:MAG: hypothetical protein C4529_04555 [Deltaproteobacteria bacterium]